MNKNDKRYTADAPDPIEGGNVRVTIRVDSTRVDGIPEAARQDTQADLTATPVPDGRGGRTMDFTLRIRSVTPEGIQEKRYVVPHDHVHRKVLMLLLEGLPDLLAAARGENDEFEVQAVLN